MNIRQELHKALFFKWLRAMAIALCVFVLFPFSAFSQRNFSNELSSCTEENPICIGTAEDLLNFSIKFDEIMNLNGGYYPAPVYLSITDDIDMTGYDSFVPLGYKVSATLGYSISIYCEGNNKTISNLTINVKDDANSASVGFVSTMQSGYVKNLNLKNASVRCSFPEADNGRFLFSAGILVGILQGGIVENCSVSGTLSVSSSMLGVGIGGVIGCIYSLDQEITDTREIKDIVAECRINIEETYNCYDDASTFFDSNEINSIKYNIGGVIGVVSTVSTPSSKPVSISNLKSLKGSSINLLNSDVSSLIGGVIGFVYKESQASVLNISDLSNYSDLYFYNSQAVGGVVGAVQGNLFGDEDYDFTLHNLHNGGNVSALKYVGGVVGISHLCKLDGCVNVGQVFAGNNNSDFVSGIVGSHYIHSCKGMEQNYLSGCVNVGDVVCLNKSAANVGSIVGRFSQKESAYSYSTLYPFSNIVNLSDSLEIVGNFDIKCIDTCEQPTNLEFFGVYQDTVFKQVASQFGGSKIVNYSTSDLVSSSLKTRYLVYDENSMIVSKMLNRSEAEAEDANNSFVFIDGYYPMVGDNDISILASSPFVLSEGETVREISSDFKVKGTEYDVVWTSKNGLIRVSGEDAMIRGTGSDTLIASLNGMTKKVGVRLVKNVFGGGLGTETSPYLIKNKAHFKELSDSVEASDNGLKERYFRVVADIADVDLVVAYNPRKPFSGYIDGENHLIELNISGDSTFAALFGNASEATIKNIQTSGRVEGKTYSAGVVAYATNCNISCCFNTAKVSGVTAGGVVGYIKEGGVYYNLCNSGSISGSASVGGTIGYTTGNASGKCDIHDLVNSGFVCGSGSQSYVGGLIGGADSKNTPTIVVTRLFNYGSVCRGGMSSISPIIGYRQYAKTTGDVADIQICQNGQVNELDRSKDVFSQSCPSVYEKKEGTYPVPSWVMEMKDWELLAYPVLLQNGEFASDVQTEPKLYEGLVMKSVRHIDSTETYTNVLDLQQRGKKAKAVVEFALSESATGMSREVYLEIMPNFFSCGSGTESDPYCIKTKEDIDVLSKLVSGTEAGYKFSYFTPNADNWTKGKCFKQMSDIEIVTSPIGAGSFEKFQGVYDGNNLTVKLNLNSKGLDCVALFARCGEDAVVKNLHVTGNISGKDTVATIIGKVVGGESTTEFTNLSSSANVSGSKCVGGVIGYLDSKNASADNLANGGKVTAEYDAGGIFAYSNADVSRATNTGNIVSVYNDKSAGIVARYDGGSISVSSNAGLVKGGVAAGVVADNGNGDVVDCFNYGAIIGDTKYGIANTSSDFSYIDEQVSLCNSLSGSYTTSQLLNKEGEIRFVNKVWEISSQYKYPYISYESEQMNKISSISSSAVVLGGKDKADKVQNVFSLYASDGAFWSAMKNDKVVEISSKDAVGEIAVYQAVPKAIGTDTLVVTLDGMERHIPIYVDCVPTVTTIERSGCDTVEIYNEKGEKQIISIDGDTTITFVFEKEGTACDSTVIYKISIHKPVVTHIDTAICKPIKIKDSDGVVRTIFEDADFKVVENSCDTTIWHIRTITPEVYTDSIAPACEFVYYGNIAFTESTTLTDVVKSQVCDCDSVVHNVVITVYPKHEIVDVLPFAIDSMLYDGVVYRSDTLLTIFDGMSSVGCDSVHKVFIRIIGASVDVEDIYVCDRYSDKGVTYTSDVQLYDTTIVGEEVNVKIRNVMVYHNTAKDTAYLNEIYGCGSASVNNVTYYRDTVLYTNVPRENKCDSIVVQKVFVHSPVQTILKDTIFACEKYEDAVSGLVLTESVTLCDTLSTADLMCDSIITRQPYMIEKSVYETMKVNGCEVAVYNRFNGEMVEFTSSMSFKDTLYSSRGCIRKVKDVDIVIANPIDTYFDTLSCSPIEYEGKIYNKGVTQFVDTIPNSTGDCDSLIRHIKISVLDKITKDTIIYGCQSATVNGETFYQPYQEIEKSVGKAKNGVCDSFVLFRIFVLQPMETNEVVKGCGEVVYDGVTYTQDAELVKYLTSKRCDCDSTVYVHIRIGNSDFVEIDTADCGSVVLNGVTYTNDAVVEENFTNSYGCDSLVRYNVHILHPSYETITVEGESSVEYDGVVYRRSQTIVHNTVNSFGCDSVVTVNIKINKDLGYPIIVDKFGYVLFCNNNIGDVKFEKYQWYRNGEPIDGAVKEYYEGVQGVKLEGCYSVAVWNASGREFRSETHCIEKERTLSVYPNPVSFGENVYIDYEFTIAERKELMVEVYSARGVLLREFKPTAYPIVIDGIKNIGQYFVILRLSDEKVLDAKFIVK